MLVLTRYPDESITIDGGIKITVMEIQNGQVSLAIDAPEEVKVYCEEIYERLPYFALLLMDSGCSSGSVENAAAIFRHGHISAQLPAF